MGQLRLIRSEGINNRTAKVYRNAEWGEYQVKFYQDGDYLPDADYHTDDKADALSTARQYVTHSGIFSN